MSGFLDSFRANSRRFVGLSLALLSVSIAARAEENASQGFHNESEAGIVITGGNADSQSYNFKQGNTYGFGANLFKFTGKFLKTSAKSTETAKYWSLGLRYERELAERFSIFLGQTLEADRFAGYLQRYNSDVGGKYFIYKLTDFMWNAEAGYRYTVENRRSGQVNQHYLRLFTEANRDWTKTFSTRLWVEYLPNLTVSNDYQINSELSASAAISEIFAIKTGYLIKYRSILVSPATENTDTQFTTALVAKF